MLNASARAMCRKSGWGILLVLASISSLYYLGVADRFVPLHRSDLLPRWIGTREALAGKDPYSPAVLREIQTAFYGHVVAPGEAAAPQSFLYPATVVLFVAPLAKLPWKTAQLTYLLIAGPLFGWGLWLCIQNLGSDLDWKTKLVLLGLALSGWPSIWAMRMQQPTLLVAALIFIAWVSLARGEHVVPGVLLAICTIKPQVALPLILWLLLWGTLGRRWIFLASFGATLMMMLAATQLLLPGWFSHWLASLHSYTGVTRTAPPLEQILGTWPGLIATSAIVVGSAIALIRMRRCAPDSQQFRLCVNLILATTVCMIPTNVALVYNNVLLLPACLSLLVSPPSDSLASLVRKGTLVQLGWDYLMVMLAAGAAATGNSSPLLARLVFQDFLLPGLLAFAIVLELLRAAPSGSQIGATASAVA